MEGMNWLQILQLLLNKWTRLEKERASIRKRTRKTRLVKFPSSCATHFHNSWIHKPGASQRNTSKPWLEALNWTELNKTCTLKDTTMSQSRPQTQKPLLTPEQLKKKLEITNFDPNAIIRGAQLTVVGGRWRLLQSFNYNHWCVWSSASFTESKTVYQRSLQASCFSCCGRNCHSAGHLYSGRIVIVMFLRWAVAELCRYGVSKFFSGSYLS